MTNGYILALFDNYLLASDDINAHLRFIKPLPIDIVYGRM